MPDDQTPEPSPLRQLWPVLVVLAALSGRMLQRRAGRLPEAKPPHRPLPRMESEDARDFARDVTAAKRRLNRKTARDPWAS